MPDRDRLKRGNGFFYLSAFVIVAALVLGGGTRSGFLSDAILQLIALPLLLVALWRLSTLPSQRSLRFPLAFCAAMALAPLLQLVPLPPELWTGLPHRAPEIEALELIGQPLPWMPISVAPHATALSALSLIVPVAIFLSVAQLGYDERSRLSLIIIVAGLASVFLGLSQVAQGPTSPLRFFAISNNTEAVGFFANRNHFAALLYSVTLLAAAWTVNAALASGGDTPHQGYDAQTIIALIASFTAMVMLVAAQAMARSRGGLGLTIVALVGALVLAFSDRRGAAGVTPAKILAGAVCVAMLFAAQFALYRIMERFTVDPLQDSRIAFGHTTLEAAAAFMPFGSGMGTFAPVYAAFEKPQDVLANTYVNRAHNDLLEIALELGAAGVLLMGAFLVWYAARTVAVWRRSATTPRDIDLLLARTSTVIVALLIAHSVVDYPLRTGAMMAVFAFACALLTEPAGARHRAHARTTSHAAPVEPAAQPLAPDAWPRGERWGKNIEWPDAWKPGGGAGGRKPGDR